MLDACLLKLGYNQQLFSLTGQCSSGQDWTRFCKTLCLAGERQARSTRTTSWDRGFCTVIQKSAAAAAVKRICWAGSGLQSC